MILEIIIIILSLIIILLGYLVYNTFSKYEKLEQLTEENYNYFIESYNSMKEAYDHMKAIDRLGAFESDDESGGIFKEIKEAMNVLNDKFNLDNETEN